MRRIGANYIITNTGEAIRNGYLELEDDGTILNIISPKTELQEVSGLEFYNGVLVPGFVNSHAHLELSYMKDRISQHKKLPHFISTLRGIREKAKPEEVLASIQEADQKMLQEGIVLVGDIANTAETIETKKNSSLLYQTFVEVFGIDKNRAHDVFDTAQKILEEYTNAGIEASISPHATYSVSEKLFKLISEASYTCNATLSIHNQETASENEMFTSKSGKLFELFTSMGIDFSSWYPTGHNALPSTIIHLPRCSKINLVHNTFTSQNDIDKVADYSSLVYWTVCPNANLFIENRLPDIDLFYENKLKLCVGTDSLASNTQLSMLEELKTIQENFPKIPFVELIKWATYNGAEMLDKISQFGSFEKGKKPGVVLIENFDFDKFNLKSSSKSRLLL